jgi:lipopolysaccharide/colanic/teichoic acid biosynthesis glycosyltransferase
MSMEDHDISDLRLMIASGVMIVVIIIILKDEPGDWPMWTRRIAYAAAFLNMVRALLTWF